MALIAVVSFSQTGCSGYVVSTGPGYGYVNPVYPVGWGGAGFYGGAWGSPYYRSWNSSGNVNTWRGGSASWNHGSGSATGWRGGSASWGGGSGSWSGPHGGGGSWHR